MVLIPDEKKISEFLNENRILLVLGSGGVGKTTTSLALAMLAAMEGKKVGLISIDPAKRLANAVGLVLGHQLSQIDLGGVSGSGQLWAAMLDQKAVFDQLVEKYSPSHQIRDRIFQNQIYKSISRNLGGPLEYMALAKIHEMIQQDFQLIVIDTPPDTQALQFLEKPAILGSFMENRVMNWLVKPFSFADKVGMFKVLTLGERFMMGIAKVTGLGVLRSLVEFLTLMETTVSGLHDMGTNIKKILHQSSTGFVCVGVCHDASVRSTKKLVSEIDRLGYHLKAIIINKTLPQVYVHGIEAWINLPQEKQILAKRFSILRQKVENINIMERSLKKIGQDYDKANLTFFKIEERIEMIQSLEALMEFARGMKFLPHAAR